MKNNDGYLKPCNNPFKEKAEKLQKRAIIISIIIGILTAIIALIIVFLT